MNARIVILEIPVNTFKHIDDKAVSIIQLVGMAPTHGAPNIGPTSGVAVARLVKCFCGRCTFNGVPLLLPLVNFCTFFAK